MTRKERVEKLRCLITCMKCEVSGKECDNNCPTQYDAGNMGEIIENLEEIAKALEQEPCEDAISRQAVLDIAKSSKSNWIDNSVLYKRINELPSVTPKEKTGHWVHGEYCSECNCDVPAYLIDWKWQKDMDAKYCPNCGAKMESEVEE